MSVKIILANSYSYAYLTIGLINYSHKKKEVVMPTKQTIRPDRTPFFIPQNLLQGDLEFSGHGPKVTVSCTIRILQQRFIMARVEMNARETKSNWTTVEGHREYCIWRARPNQRLLRITSSDHSSANYTDRNTADDVITMPSGELVSKFTCVGDTEGKDALVKTGFSVDFNPITFEWEEVPINMTKVKDVPIPNPTPKFIPQLTGPGDADFAGHGPRVDVFANIKIENQREIWADIEMSAKETLADWTEANDREHVQIYVHDKPILEILSPTTSEDSYIDFTKTDDKLYLGSQELVSYFKCTGDTQGPDAGLNTGVSVYWNPITILEA
jgi:hypothetical protein